MEHITVSLFHVSPFFPSFSSPVASISCSWPSDFLTLAPFFLLSPSHSPIFFFCPLLFPFHLFPLFSPTFPSLSLSPVPFPSSPSLPSSSPNSFSPSPFLFSVPSSLPVFFPGWDESCYLPSCWFFYVFSYFKMVSSSCSCYCFSYAIVLLWLFWFIMLTGKSQNWKRNWKSSGMLWNLKRCAKLFFVSPFLFSYVSLSALAVTVMPWLHILYSLSTAIHNYRLLRFWKNFYVLMVGYIVQIQNKLYWRHSYLSVSCSEETKPITTNAISISIEWPKLKYKIAISQHIYKKWNLNLTNREGEWHGGGQKYRQHHIAIND